VRLRSLAQRDHEQLLGDKQRVEKDLALQVALLEREVQHLRSWNDDLARSASRGARDAAGKAGGGAVGGVAGGGKGAPAGGTVGPGGAATAERANYAR